MARPKKTKKSAAIAVENKPKDVVETTTEPKVNKTIPIYSKTPMSGVVPVIGIGSHAPSAEFIQREGERELREHGVIDANITTKYLYYDPWDDDVKGPNLDKEIEARMIKEGTLKADVTEIVKDGDVEIEVKVPAKIESIKEDKPVKEKKPTKKSEKDAIMEILDTHSNMLAHLSIAIEKINYTISTLQKELM